MRTIVQQFAAEAAIRGTAAEGIRAVPPEKLSGDILYFMNREALTSADERVVDVTAEEGAVAAPPEAPETALVGVTQPVVGPEKMEEVLNSGMAFIGGLLEMAPAGSSMPPPRTAACCTSTWPPAR
jgi:hypothetical protein